MSDVNGMDALNAVLDRLVDAIEEKRRQEAKAFDAECCVRELEREVKSLGESRDYWNRLAIQRANEVGRLRSKLTPEQLAAPEPTPSPDEDIAF